MKIRSGFVSNSSSSSFIIGWGVVKNEERLQEYLTNNGLKFGYDLRRADPSQEDDWNLVGGNYTTILVPEQYKGENVVIATVHNSEGDLAFYDNESDEMDYSIAETPDYYSFGQKKIIDLFHNKDIFSKSYVQIGAERDG